MEPSIASVIQEREVLKMNALERVRTSLKLLAHMNSQRNDSFSALVQDALSHTVLARQGFVNDGQRDAVLRLLLRGGFVSHLDLAHSTLSEVDTLVRQNLFLLEV